MGGEKSENNEEKKKKIKFNLKSLSRRLQWE